MICQRFLNYKYYKSDVDSVVSYIVLPPAEAGGWPSSTRFVSKIKPNKDGFIYMMMMMMILIYLVYRV